MSNGKTPRELYAEQHGEKAARKADQQMLVGIARSIAEMVSDGLKREGATGLVGFAVITFDIGESGSLAYASNANREDFLRLLDELRGKLAAEVPNAPKGD